MEMKPRLSSKLFAIGLSACSLLATGSAAAVSFTIGNNTPSTSFIVQGQSFTPSVGGNGGSGTPPAAGTVLLDSFTIDFLNPASGFNSLYIYSSLPTTTDAATGIGSLGTGSYLGNGVYKFNDLSLDVNTKYFAVLPGPARIFDGNGDRYNGGVDLFDRPGTNNRLDEGFGTFDIGFRASLTTVPIPAAWILMASGVAFLGTRRRH